jgi:hypothetical protein
MRSSSLQVTNDADGYALWIVSYRRLNDLALARTLAHVCGSQRIRLGDGSISTAWKGRRD